MMSSVFLVLKCFVFFFIGEYALQPVLGAIWPYSKQVYASLSRKEQKQWGPRLVTVLHALVSCAIAAPVYLAPDATISAAAGGDPVFGFSPRAQRAYAFSCAFFIWDAMVCLRDRWGFGFVCHAVACTFCYAAGMQPFLHHIGCFFLLYEASTPFLHLRWFMRVAGRGESAAYVRVSQAFAAAFGFVRIVLGLPISAAWWTRMVPLLGSSAGAARLAEHGISPVVVVLYLACNIILNFLNIAWFKKIAVAALGGDATPVNQAGEKPASIASSADGRAGRDAAASAAGAAGRRSTVRNRQHVSDGACAPGGSML